MPTRLVGVLVDALFPPAADALAGTLDEVAGRLLFGGGGRGSISPLPLLALGVVARPAAGAKSTAKVQVLLRPAPLDPRDFFGKLPKLAAAAAAHATASPATAATTPEDAAAGAAALKSFVGVVSRAAAAAAPASTCAPVVWVFGHAFGSSPSTWAAVLNTLPPGVTVKFLALPAGLPPASAAAAGLALARFADEAVSGAEAASLTVVRCDPASLRAAVLGGILRDLAGSGPVGVRLRLPAPIGGVTALVCLAQSELAPLAAPAVAAGGPACPCHGAPLWVAGTTSSYQAGVCPISGRGVRLDACALNPRLLRVGTGGGSSAGAALLTLAPTLAAQAVAGELVLHPPGGGVLGWGGEGGESGGGGGGGGGGQAALLSAPTLHVVACVPAASLDLGSLFGTPTILVADPLAEEEEEEEEEEAAARAPPPLPLHAAAAWPRRGGPRARDPFAGPSSDSDDGGGGLSPMAGAHAPSSLLAPGVPAFAALCAALRSRGDALVAAGRVDLLGGGGGRGGGGGPTSFLRYYALSPSSEGAACLLVVGLAGDEERLPLSVPAPGGGGADGAAFAAEAAAALNSVRIPTGIGAAALACGLRGRVAGLAGRCVTMAQGAPPPLPPVASGGGGSGAGGAPQPPPPPPVAGSKRRKALATAAALCMAVPAVRE